MRSRLALCGVVLVLSPLLGCGQFDNDRRMGEGQGRDTRQAGQDRRDQVSLRTLGRVTRKSFSS